MKFNGALRLHMNILKPQKQQPDLRCFHHCRSILLVVIFDESVSLLNNMIFGLSQGDSLCAFAKPEGDKQTTDKPLVQQFS